uniref:Uncharacterized protein n=1 Tax=Oryza sativa subsp. japonica TaxID=39947 RepID=Q7F105_ORYSJ|nr:hypothetical protein [Oryza sativa Japonica Group]BAD30209.1 hypothetical protein [Oryza sativa Japonica Group]
MTTQRTAAVVAGSGASLLPTVVVVWFCGAAFLLGRDRERDGGGRGSGGGHE